MKLTSRSEYALLALVYPARDPERRVSVGEIAREREMPVKFLEQILLVLKQNRLLVSTKGRNGGYQLSRPPKKISLAEVVRLFDGALAPTDSVSKFYYRATPIEKEKKLHKLFQRVRDSVAKIMEETTIADIL